MALYALTKSDHLAQNRKKIQDAFKRFEGAIYPDDAKYFRDLSLEDVWKAARGVEREQSERRALRNTRRLEPFFEALKTLGVILGPLCQGVPFLCFAWIFDRNKAYENLIEVYSEIAKSLPRFERLSEAFRNQPEFQDVLVDVYTDILEIHLEVYKIVRRSGWRRLFDTCWKDFGLRLKAILSRLATNRDLVDREAASFEIVEAMEERRKSLLEANRKEMERLDEYSRQVFEWLQLGERDREQEDILNDFQEARVQNTCEWLMKHPEIRTWLDEEDKRQVLWLKGKPGSGKSTLVSYLVQQAPMSSRSFLMCCMSSELLRKGESNPAGTILRLFCAQMLRKNRRLLPYIYEEYVRLNSTLSLKKVRDITKLLLDSLGPVFLVFDGLDEYSDCHQAGIIDELSRLLKPPSNTMEDAGAPDPVDGIRVSGVKVLICSRETQPILREIKKKWKQPAVINLTKEHEYALMSEDISRFAQVRLRALSEDFDQPVLDKILESLTNKADSEYETTTMLS
ncbi:hypothetical protein GQ607_007337 [Colletotrichum asianum]|uniref:NACHT domain-containing protein n=1 Tax=Colletotrichum asianum TaxID=702518 RepID=A0A8H3WC75_9PEZI|nr:hypothetical protein GQ607_007337 [Colletotrichum asianum]